VAVSFIGGGNHRPAVSHWQTLSHNVVSSTSRHNRDSNFSGDRHNHVDPQINNKRLHKMYVWYFHMWNYMCIREIICVYVKLYVYMWNYMCICKIICVYVKLYVYMWNYMCICEIICVYVKLYVYMWNYMCICEIVCVYVKLFKTIRYRNNSGTLDYCHYSINL
jgi:hypothetical protein